MKTKFNIPNDTILLKISSFYANINDDINRNDTIKMISNYVFSDVYNMEIDIICIQGIKDEKLVKMLVSEITEISVNLKIPINIVPRIELNSSNSQDNSIHLTWNNISENDNFDINNIIVSKYPIISTSKVTLNNSLDEKLVGCRKAIIANVNVNGYLISIFNVVLSEDYFGVSNSDFRKYEINELYKYVNLNNEEMSKINEAWGLRLINKNVNIVCSNLNIPEIKNSRINSELTTIFKTMKALDTYRTSSQSYDKRGYTNTKGIKDCYILLLLDGLNPSNTMTTNDILNYSYKIHGITIVKSYVVNSVVSNDYYPIETIFLLSNYEKKNQEEY
ncbi:hypothetical protein Catovirus_1_959 [Catovirus CTV1]|uniref:Uncharacterized protein n=1 Tax=Catovirus CTV1 TaxID=1977631 RepID=A0A1V0SB34_9VIRU|nr:hypothetical protein Catovirus_1_959 [Catovirus CTV1]